MKKLLLVLFVSVLSLPLFAQLEVKPNSFKEVNGFVNIDPDKQTDDNDQPYAVVKVKTENINDKQRRELEFQGDARTFFELEYRDGEVWLYISYYATFIKISHPDLSSTEFYFPYDLQPKKGYELTLVNNAKSDMDEEKVLSLIEQWQQSNATNNANTEPQPQPEPVKKEGYGFITANASINQYGDLAYGLSFGKVNKLGWFVSLMSNFNFKGLSCDYECDSDFYVGTYYPDYNGDTDITSISATVGMMVRVAKPLSLRVGVGYGIRNTVYGTVNGKTVKNSAISVEGVDASLGAQIKLGGFVMSADAVTTNFKTIEAKIGLGYGF
jgi:hypothetical protein